jgi:phosphoesterase RecJ-like protein
MDFQIIKSRIYEAERIVITSHQSPDGDAVGSSLALYHYLKLIGKEVCVILPDVPPAFLMWLDGASDILTFDSNTSKCEALIESSNLTFSLDYNDLSRMGDMGSAVEKSSAFKVMIDHHLDPKDFADWQISDTNVCSTAQLIYEFIVGMGDENKIDTRIGAGIYCGIVTDSGSFRFSSVDARSHEIAAKLLKLGLQHNIIHENLFDVNSLNRLQMLGYSLCNKLKVLPNIPVAVIYLTKEELQKMDNKKGSTEGLVNYALSVEGVQMAAFIKEDENKVKMSFRSKGTIPVNEFSGKYFSGGGHRNAAGGVSYESMEKTIEKFEKVIYDFWNE